jgi:hypothetical protein
MRPAFCGVRFPIFYGLTPPESQRQRLPDERKKFKRELKRLKLIDINSKDIRTLIMSSAAKSGLPYRRSSDDFDTLQQQMLTY